MLKFKKLIKRVVMTLLFTLAFLTTFQTITGVNAQILMENSPMMIKSLDNTDENGDHSMNHPFKSIGLGLKYLKESLAPKTLISSSEAIEGTVPPLEEAFNWDKDYARKTVVATGYTAGYESTGKHPGHPSYGITYSGVKVKRDMYSTIAADLNVFPLGTILFIPNYGFGVVADKGSAIKGNKIDLYFETVEDVYNQWGKKTVEVYVVQMGNGKLTSEELESLNANESMQVFRSQYGLKNSQ